MDGSPKKSALLALRKQIQALIAHEEAEDPEAAAEGHADAAQTMAGAGMDGDADMGAKPEASEVQMKFMDYLKPKAKPRRPGTGLIMGAATVHKGPEKKPMGRPKREVG
jgi:hypothetical protein